MDGNNTESKNGVSVNFADAVRGLFGGRKKGVKGSSAVRLRSADLTRVDLLEMLAELGRENVRLKDDLEDRNREIEKLKLLVAARKANKQEQEL